MPDDGHGGIEASLKSLTEWTPDPCRIEEAHRSPRNSGLCSAVIGSLSERFALGAFDAKEGATNTCRHLMAKNTAEVCNP
jgi:hypothetical protein